MFTASQNSLSLKRLRRLPPGLLAKTGERYTFSYGQLADAMIEALTEASIDVTDLRVCANQGRKEDTKFRFIGLCFTVKVPDLKMPKGTAPTITVMCSQGGAYGTIAYLGAAVKDSPTGIAFPELVFRRRNTNGFDPKTVAQDIVSTAMGKMEDVAKMVKSLDKPLKRSVRNSILMEVGRSTKFTWTRVGAVDKLMHDRRQTYLELAKAVGEAAADYETVKQPELLRNVQSVIQSKL